MVVDTSALLAVIFDESLASWVIDHFERHRSRLLLGSLNYAETLIRAADRYPNRIGAVREVIDLSFIEIVPVTVRHAELAAVARLKFPLNLGDCFAYALAKDENCSLLTLDRDFKRCDVPVILPRTN